MCHHRLQKKSEDLQNAQFIPMAVQFNIRI